MTTELFVAHLMSGLARAAVYFLMASGLTLTLGALNLVNFAHGTFYMFGAYLGTVVIAEVGGDMGFLAAIVGAPLVLAVAGGLLDRTLLSRVYSRGHMAQMLATFALVLIGDDVVRRLFGNRPRAVRRPGFLDGSVGLLGARIPIYNLAMIAVAAGVAVALCWLLLRTRTGLQLRALVDDGEMLGVLGTDMERLRTAVFAGGAGLAGLAGMLMAPVSAVRPGIDVELLIVAFAVVIIGGMGSIAGAVAGALVVGVVESFGVYYVERGAVLVVFAVMVVCLGLRPKGLLPQGAR